MFSRRTVATLRHQQYRYFSSTPIQHADFTHAVIGGGAVGLAIARRLQKVDGAQVVLIEKHGMVGSETSSRNSEVIHAGIYYGKDTLKTNLCLRGKEMLYELCEKYEIPHMKCGKWVVAQNSKQMDALQGVYEHAKSIGAPMRFISKDEAEEREPAVRAEAGALESPTTGIIDSHTYMQFLQGDFEDAGGVTALASPVSRIEAPTEGATETEWKIWTSAEGASEAQWEDDAITASTLINSAGLFACSISNMILPPERHRKPYYAKGTYYSYSKSSPKTSTLIYPAPVPGHGGLGTHLTLDMGGRVRFGPDVEWIDDPNDYTPNANPERFKAAIEDIKQYLPGLDEESVAVDYCGIRPKLGKSGAQNTGKGGFIDFYIKKEDGVDGFVNLLGIESPGLTSSLAIAEYVHDLLYK
jgi:L-2-hydroxyglutarate oxidase LhgO